MKRAARVSTLAAAILPCLVALVTTAACGRQAPPDVPPPTSARPAVSTLVPSGPLTTSGGHGPTHDHALHAPKKAGPARAALSPRVAFVKGGETLEVGVCVRVVIAATRGMLATRIVYAGSGVAPKHADLGPGDSLVVTNVASVALRGDGLAVAVRQDLPVCTAADVPPSDDVAFVKASTARELRWAGGKMTAHHDVLGPDLYVGRLEGTAPVAEHDHATSIEVLAAVEGAGTFTVGGKDERLVAPQVVVIPAGLRHAWKPDPGTRLVAVQTYAPPGPEQRFLALDAAERDAGAR